MTPRRRLMFHARGRVRLFSIMIGIAGVALSGASCPLFTSPAPIGGAIRLEQIAQGLVSPVKLVASPDGSGRLFVVDQIGLIRIIDAGGALLATPFLDVRGRMVSLSPDYDERGLLGLAFHPDYVANGRFFVFYTAPTGAGVPAGFDSESHISEFRVSGDANLADASSEQVLLRIPKPQSNHNGGDLAFGPDGFLYLSTGDGGGANDVDTGHMPGIGNGQDLSTLLGKILRIDVDSGSPYSNPADNPFVGTAGARGEVFAYGLRNPFRIAFDMGGAHRLFAGDVGQGLFEEADIIVRGGDYGWNIREGAHCFDPNHSGSPPASCATTGADGAPLAGPIIEYPHSDSSGGPHGEAVIGGCVYRGAAAPALAGRYVFGDWSRGSIGADGSLFGATEGSGGAWTVSELTIAGSANGRLGRFVIGFGQDAAGEVYVLTSDHSGPNGTTGRVFRLAAP